MPYTLAITRYYTLFTPRSYSANADCDNLAQHGYRHQDGVYTLRVAHFEPFQAYCEMSERGWTVIQRRVDSSVNFFR